VSNCVGIGMTDGRLNSAVQDEAAPVAVYCSPVGDGGIDVYAIDGSTSEGTLASRTSGADVDAALARAGSSQIASGLGATLWASGGNVLTVIAGDLNGEGKTYRFDFSGDACG